MYESLSPKRCRKEMSPLLVGNTPLLLTTQRRAAHCRRHIIIDVFPPSYSTMPPGAREGRQRLGGDAIINPMQQEHFKFKS